MFRKVKILITDVDGVLTDGKIIYDKNDNELKFFNVKDGFGLHLLHKAGIKTAIITGRESPIVVRRAQELQFTRIYQNVRNKAKIFYSLIDDLGLSPEETCYVGDDIPDLPVIKLAGVGVAVADAVDEIREIADYTCKAKGGQGAIREVAEQILKDQRIWDSLINEIKYQ